MSNGNGGGDGGGGFSFGDLFNGLIASLEAAIEAIIAFLQALVSAIVDALNFLLGGIESTFGFSFEGLGQIWQGISKMMDRIWRAVVLAALKKLWSLYKTLLEWARKLKAWLDKLHALMKKYQMMYFRKVIQLIQRARKILTIFRFFHLKFAQKLDNWLATIEGKLAHYMILVAQKENQIISWVDFIVDPLGNLKKLPLIAGFITALDATWAGIFGTPFTKYFSGVFSRGQTASVSSSLGKTAAAVRNGAGDAGRVQSMYSATQAGFISEAGGQ